MQLPLTANPVIAWFDAASGRNTFKANGSTSNLESLKCQITGLAATQTNEAAKPTHVHGDIGGTAGFNSKYPSASFAGGQYLSYDNLVNLIGSKFTIYVVAYCSTPSSASPMAFVSLGSSGNTKTYFYAASSDIQIVDTNAANTTTTVDTAITRDGAVHVYSFLVDNAAGSITLRKDGVQIGTHSTTGTHTYNFFTIGALNTGGSVTRQFAGGIGAVVVTQNTVDYPAIEAFLMSKYQTANANRQ